MFVRISVAAATAVVDYDIAGNTWWQIHDRARILRRFGLVGSANPGDTVLELFYGTRKIAQLSNSTSGANKEPVDSDMKWALGNEVCPVGTPVHLLVKVAPGTNAIVFNADFAEI